MKKIFSIVLLLILAVPACWAWAQEDSERIAAHSVEAIQQRGTLRVASSPGTAR